MKKYIGPMTVRLSLMAVAGILLLCGGCGQQAIPDPPLGKNRLLIEAMENVQHQHHGVALARLKKLQVIYPDNQHLASMGETEYDNIFIQKIQSGLDKGEIATTLSIIKRAEDSRALNQTLNNIKDELLQLNALNNALAKLAKPASASAIKDAVKQARQLIKKYPAAKSYLPLLAGYDKLADRMAKDEVVNAKLDLASDFETEKHRRHPDQELVNVLAAETEVEHASLK